MGRIPHQQQTFVVPTIKGLHENLPAFGAEVSSSERKMSSTTAGVDCGEEKNFFMMWFSFRRVSGRKSVFKKERNPSFTRREVFLEEILSFGGTTY
jgi:hypothetical protein